MDKFFLLLITVMCFSCGGNSKGKDEVINYKISSMVDTSSDSRPDSMTKKANISDSQDLTSADYIYWDTVGVSTAPIKVIKAWFYTKEYSTYKDIAVTYKNVSTKKITAIRFRWYGLTAFGDPADMGIKDGFGGGFTESSLSPGNTRTSEWSILSRNGKKVVKAWPTEVMFDDGTKWKSTYKSPYE